MSISSNFPALKPSLLLDFANVEALDPRITFTRTTTATYYDASGVLQTAPAGEARFDHNPTTGESLGLLVEEQRTNLLLRSEEFDNAAWNKTNATVTANQVIAPDGTLAGDVLIPDGTNSSLHRVGVTFTVVTGTTYTFSAYVKAGGYGFLGIQQSASGGAGLAERYSIINLSTSALVSETVTGSTSVISVGNGWYRVSLTTSATTGGGTPTFRLVALNTGSTSAFAGDGSSGIYIWGAQLEAGAFPTSYIPTVAATVTRNADAASMTGTNFSSWYRADEGTFYGESQWTTTTARNNSPLFRVDDGTNNNYLQLGFRNVSPTAPATIAVRVSGGSEPQPTSPTVATNDGLPHKFAGAYTAAQLQFSADNQTAGTATPSGLPVVNIARIGASNVGVPSLYAIYIRKLAFYPKALTAAELQGLTT